MIRGFGPADTDAVIGIWLAASVAAHDFVAPEFWESRAQDMRCIYLPSAENYVWEEAGVLEGFISLVDGHIAALFVSPRSQGAGIGSRLLDFAKQRHANLELAVYKENTRSVKFYESRGFRRVGESVDPQTGHPEILMRYP